MSALSAFLLLPAALLLDRLLGNPGPHPSCLRHGGPGRHHGTSLPPRSQRATHDTAGLAACLAVVLPVACWRHCLSGLPERCSAARPPGPSVWSWSPSVWRPAAWTNTPAVWPLPLEQGDLEAARRAVSMLVGRDPQQLDAHGVARACVESVGENLTDGILSTLFWAAAGLLLAGLPGAAALAACHRAANVLDAMWGKLNETYRCFGTAAARLDDVLNWCPARLAPALHRAGRGPAARPRCPCLPPGGLARPPCPREPQFRLGEAAFAGALGLRLGGPAWYGPLYRDHPWLGDGTPLTTARHIRQAVRLMWGSLLVFATLASLLPAAVACI